MGQNPFENKKPTQEQPNLRVEIATPEDWEAYRELRLCAITGKDKDMFEISQHPEEVEKEKNKTEQEWRDALSQKDSFVVLSWKGSQATGMGTVSRKEKYWWIGGGYVREDLRNGGTGKKIFAKRLLKILETEKQGGIKIRTGMDAENDVSIHIATLFGFKQTTEDIEEGDFEMELDLTDPEVREEVIRKINKVLDAR